MNLTQINRYLIFDVFGNMRVPETFDAPELMSKLLSSLKKLNIKVNVKADNCIEFFGPTGLVGNWQLFASVSTGFIYLKHTPSTTWLLSYKVSLSRFWIPLVISIVIVFVMGFKQIIPTRSFILSLVFLAGIYVIGWVGFSLRFRSFLKKAIYEDVVHNQG